MSLSSLFSSVFISYEALFVLILTSVTCALIGTFLVLRKLSMVSDAISHSVLLGIVLAFFVTKDVTSPLLIIGAAIFGVLTVFSIEILSSTGLVKNDDAVGVVFPLFFALAVILITKYARNVHLDTDIVLMGEVIMSPLNRIDFLGYSIPKALFQMSLMLIVNLSFIIIFFKELKVTTFDMEFASLAGFSSSLLFYILMTLSSLTAVISFDAVGAILVVSFLITPAATAYLISKDLKVMLVLSSVFAVINSVLGYIVALALNVSMSGLTATFAGLSFLLVFLFARDGMITRVILRTKKKKNFKMDLLIMHIGNHMNTDQDQDELGVSTIKNHLVWKEEQIEKQVKKLIDMDLVQIMKDKNIYILTEKGLAKYKLLSLEYGLR